MADPELQGRVNRLDEVTVVQAHLMERLEQKYDGAIQRHDDAIKKHDEEIADLRSAMLLLNSALTKTNTAVEMTSANVEKLRSVAEAHQDSILELRAFQTAVLERFDRFLRGQEGNGRKQ